MSKNLIFYFSGTGNSLSVAMELENQLSDATVVPILSIKADYVIPSDVETAGFVYPIYMNAIPQMVREFIGRIKIEKKCFVYGIATHGGSPGKAGCHLNKVLKAKDIDLKAYFEICMINNTPKGVAPVFLMNMDWEKGITKEIITPILQQVKKDIYTIALSIQARETDSIKKNLGR